MRTFYQVLFALPLSILLFSACNKNEQPDPQVTPDPIQFDAMEVGQKWRYLGLLGEDYGTSQDSFTYTDDTLVLEVIAKDQNGFLIEETLIYNGSTTEFLSQNKDAVFRYYLEVVDDTLRYTKPGTPFPQSRIFSYLTAVQGLPFQEFSTNELEVSGWKPNIGYCECRYLAYTKDYTLFGRNYDRLNILVENRAMATDASGETYIYSSKHGIVRFSTYNPWTQRGYGWDLLP